MVLDIANELYNNRPLIISSEEKSKDIMKLNNKGLLSCYSIVLLQEQERYNKLILGKSIIFLIYLISIFKLSKIQ